MSGFPRGKPGETAADVDILVTAAEAYPALERAFLSAEREIVAGFRVFDLKTRLRSAEGLAVGETWFHLMIHTLRRGVAVRLVRELAATTAANRTPA